MNVQIVCIGEDEYQQDNIKELARDLTEKDAEEQRRLPRELRDKYFSYGIRFLFYCKQFEQAARCVLSGDLFRNDGCVFYTRQL